VADHLPPPCPLVVAVDEEPLPRAALVAHRAAPHAHPEAIALDREAEPKLPKRNDDDGKPPIFVEGLS